MSGWALPAEIEAEIAASRVQTDCEPSLALNHALALDRRLAAMGWTQPVTFGATGVTCGGAYLPQDAMYRASDPEAVGRSSLHRAARLATTGDESGAVKLAYREAVKAELAALNLLYANAALRVEHLWLHFANKYLAHVAAAAGKASAPYALGLTAGAGSRFQRMVAAGGSATRAQTQGPLVSVLVPIFNAAATLAKAVQSLQGQTWGALEIILIDDCSSDDSLAIAHRLATADARIKVLPLQANGGPYIAKNVGLTQARGEFVTVHDADDWAFPTRIADQLAPLLGDASGRLRVSVGMTLRMEHSGRFTRFQPTDWQSRDGALRFCPPSPLFQRSYFDHVLGAWDSVMIGADMEIIQRVQRFDPSALTVLELPVMIQLDVAESLTRNPHTQGDGQGEAPVRTAYRRAWNDWHDRHTTLPRLPFPQRPRPFAVPEGLQRHALGVEELLRND